MGGRETGRVLCRFQVPGAEGCVYTQKGDIYMQSCARWDVYICKKPARFGGELSSCAGAEEGAAWWCLWIYPVPAPCRHRARSWFSITAPSPVGTRGREPAAKFALLPLVKGLLTRVLICSVIDHA